MYHSLKKPKQTHKGHDKYFMSKTGNSKQQQKKEKKFRHPGVCLLDR